MLANRHLTSFQGQVKRVRRLLSRQLILLSEGLVPKSEIESIYELAFLKIFVSFENELYELFKTNMLMKYDFHGHRRSLVTFENRSITDKILLGSSKYVQLLPVEQLEKIAKVYLKDGIPFTCLNANSKRGVSQGHIIRNHIAHRSEQSKIKYKKFVLDSVTLPKNSSVPGYYLSSQQTRTVTYFDHHVAEIGACLRMLCERTA